MGSLRRSLIVLLAVLFVALVGRVVPARASQLIDRDGANVKIRIDAQDRALVSYSKAGKAKAVLVWGAENAAMPSRSGAQVRFHLNYSAGAGAGFAGTCGAYDGPALPYLVAACKAPDGSYWAVQEWPAALPDLGYAPWTAAQRALNMDVSHWTGPVAKLEGYPDWVYSGAFHSLFGRYTYRGAPVYGFGTTSVGVPTDGYGRIVYLDTLDSVYGPGWMRENSFVSHNPTGVFCYGFYSFDPTKGGYQHPQGDTAKRGPGVGEKYRLTAMGPGVTPDVQATVDDPGDFDPKSADDVAFRLKEWKLFSSFIGSDKQCRLGRALGAINVEVQKSWFSNTPDGDPVTSFRLGSTVYFNVQFAQAPPASDGKLQSAHVLFQSPPNSNLSKTITDVPVTHDGLVASIPFQSTTNRRYIGDWNAVLVLNGLRVAQLKVTGIPADGTILNTGVPTISGDLRLGSVLTASTGTWYAVPTPPTRFTYQWWRCTLPVNNSWQCGSIPGATASTYTITAADVGLRLEVAVTAANSAGAAKYPAMSQPTETVTP